MSSTRMSGRAVSCALASLPLALALHGCSSGAASEAPGVASLEASSRDALVVENVGQFDRRASFLVRGSVRPGEAPQPSLWVADDGLWITAYAPATTPGSAQRAVNVRVAFEGARADATATPFRRVRSTHVSYVRGSTDRWRRDVPLWAGVRVESLYPGVDLVIESVNARWSARFEARQPEALRAVRLRVDGATGYTWAGGELRVETSVGAMSVPLASAVTEATRQSGATRSAVQAALGPLLGNNFYGGAQFDSARSVAVNSTGSVAVFVGVTASSNLPTNVGDATFNGGATDAFVAAIDSAGAPLFATYLGGDGDDAANGVTLDSQGNIYVVGETGSTNFPAPANFPGVDGTLGGTLDAFVTRLSPDASSVLYSTYLGGPGVERGNGIALAPGDRATITGNAGLAGLCANPPPDLEYSGADDAFFLRLSPSGTTIEQCGYIGVRSNDHGLGVAVGPQGDTFVAGDTQCDGQGTAPVLQEYLSGGIDAYVTRISSDGQRTLYFTYYGSSMRDGEPGNEYAYGIEVNNQNEAFVVGTSTGDRIATTPNALRRVRLANSVGRDAFAIRLSDDASVLQYGTFLGGLKDDAAYGVAHRGSDMFVAGFTESGDFPVSAGAYQTTLHGVVDAFLTRIDTAAAPGQTLVYSTLIGGAGDEHGRGVAVGPGVDPRAFVVGDSTTPQAAGQAFISRF